MRTVAFLMLTALAFAPAAAETPPRGELVEGLSCESDPTQSYTLYLPSSFDSDRLWPVLMVLDPRGRSVIAAELFREAAEDYGWVIISSNDTRSDTGPEPNRLAVNAMWSEIQTRYAPDPRRIYAAGFSGTANFAALVGKRTGALAGLIAAGGRLIEEEYEGTGFAVFGTAGNVDFNYREMRRLDAYLAEQGNHHRLEIFDGSHTWMPAPFARQAVEWMELEAMRQGARPRNGELVGGLYAADLAAAEELEAVGDLLGAHRRYQAIVGTFEGLRSVDEASQSAERLAAGPEFERARKELEKWDRYEEKRDREFEVEISAIRTADTPLSAKALLRELRIDELLRRSTKGGPEGEAAQRLLNRAFSSTSFYLVREFFEAGRYDQAEAVLEVASRIRDDSPGVWYNLACARARTDQTQEALDALERAVALGFTDAEHIESDADLESLRQEASFRAIVDRLRAQPPRD